MRKWKKIVVAMLAVILCTPSVLGMQTEAAQQEKQLDVLFTHDTHSHLNSFDTIVDGKKQEVGGFARLKTMIDTQKKNNPDIKI